MGNPVSTKAWKNLSALSLSPNTGKSDIKAATDYIHADFSGALIDDDIWTSLIDLAVEQDVPSMRDAMFGGYKINTTENRAVLHTALRRPVTDVVMADGHNVIPDIHDVLNRMRVFSDTIRAQGKITDIVNIGIGGSDLGPKMVCEALKHLGPQPQVHFVSNVDAADMTETLACLRPETTLFIIASKTFTTQETMMNAHYARGWVAEKLGENAVSDHFVALSTNRAAVTHFGITPERTFEFWDWVGGRYSLWSAIGLSVCLAYGFNVFRALLDGAYDTDCHFADAPSERNIPVLLALNGIWHRNFKHAAAYAILPYVQNLRYLPDYMQQLDMESNGKSVDRDGALIKSYQTGPIVFGQTGTNGQHAFHQWLHQGTDTIPSLFITVKDSPYNQTHHRVLNAHAQAQSMALQDGVDRGVETHRNCVGNKPCVTVTMRDMSPHSLGALLAMFEHMVFVQGVIWNINSFDQWGVELGKEIAARLLVRDD